MIKIPNLKIPEWDTTQCSNRFISNDTNTNIFTTEDFDLPIHVFSTDQFRMFEFKVRKCQRGRSHDWTECPYSHPGEKARRRDPQKYNYSGNPCPEFRKLGNCTKGDSCYFAHGVFECWLHPSRYRTQLCNDGTACRRRVCFFAHTINQLRISTKASPESFVSSPTSVLDSPPGKSRHSVVPVNVQELVGFMQETRVDDPGRVLQMGCVFGSPRGGFLSLPSTSEGVIMERVESGRDLRAKIYAKFSRMNSNSNDGVVSVPVPDIGWVSELVN
ncbi:zinc finger CCCH domain-containing protein 23-like [Trifolium pratense]|nr:zinc finger CCCH domain-containing protein 23-like [Trifolium pratense]